MPGNCPCELRKNKNRRQIKHGAHENKGKFNFTGQALVLGSFTLTGPEKVVAGKFSLQYI